MKRSRQDFRRGWHRAREAFAILSAGPTVVGTTTASVFWRTNQIASGYVEYGPTAAYGSSTTPTSINEGLDQFTHQLTGLTSGSTVYWRVNATNAAGVTRTAAGTLQTEGRGVATTVGPRSAPAVPTGANVFQVPGSIASDGTGDVSSALQAWLNGLPNGSIALMAKSANTEGFQHGIHAPVAVYRMTQGPSLTRSITIWGYGAKFLIVGQGAHANSGIRYWADGTHVLYGLEIQGTDTQAGTPSAYNSAYETQHGVNVASNSAVTIQDTWIHHVWGDPGFMAGWNDFSYTPGPMDWGWNLWEMCGRMGFTPNVNATGTFWVHHNIVRDTGMYLCSSEDEKNRTGRCKTVLIEDNRFGTYVHADLQYGARGFMFNHSWGNQAQPHILEVGPVTIRRNTFVGGTSSVMQGRYGSNQYVLDNRGILATDGDYHDIAFSENDMSGIPSAQKSVGGLAHVGRFRNATVRDNINCGAMASKVVTSEASGTISVSGNTA